MKLSNPFVQLVCAAVSAFIAIALTEAMVVVRQPPSSNGIARGTLLVAMSPLRRNQQQQQHQPTIPMVLRSTPGDNNSESDDESDDSSSEQQPSLSLLDKVNNFLDTPILDANNRSNQGALAETLKEFVRDEPEIAQVTFSVVVVAILALVTKLAVSL